jgi:hypothetical protein
MRMYSVHPYREVDFRARVSLLSIIVYMAVCLYQPMESVYFDGSVAIYV